MRLVKVYDSIFNSLDKESLHTIMKLFSSGNNKPRVRLSPSQKQKGSNDCGVFGHLVNCFNKELFSLFPVL